MLFFSLYFYTAHDSQQCRWVDCFFFLHFCWIAPIISWRDESIAPMHRSTIIYLLRLAAISGDRVSAPLDRRRDRRQTHTSHWQINRVNCRVPITHFLHRQRIMCFNMKTEWPKYQLARSRLRCSRATNQNAWAKKNIERMNDGAPQARTTNVHIHNISSACITGTHSWPLEP